MSERRLFSHQCTSRRNSSSLIEGPPRCPSSRESGHLESSGHAPPRIRTAAARLHPFAQDDPEPCAHPSARSPRGWTVTDLHRDRNRRSSAATTLSSPRTTGWMSSRQISLIHLKSQRPPRRTESSPSTEIHRLSFQLPASRNPRPPAPWPGRTTSHSTASNSDRRSMTFHSNAPPTTPPRYNLSSAAAASTSGLSSQRFAADRLPTCQPRHHLSPRTAAESFTQRHSSPVKDRRNHAGGLQLALPVPLVAPTSRPLLSVRNDATRRIHPRKCTGSLQPEPCPSSIMARMCHLSLERFQLGQPLHGLPLQWTTDHAAAVSSLPPRRRPRRAPCGHHALPRSTSHPATSIHFPPRTAAESFTQRCSSPVKNRRNGREWLANSLFWHRSSLRSRVHRPQPRTTFQRKTRSKA